MNILITGTTSGLGLSLKKEYEERGNRVFSLNRETCDLSYLSGVTPALEELIQGERIDCAYLNAGVLGSLMPTVDLSIEEIMEVVTVNALANKLIIDYLLNSSLISNVVSISSGAATKGYYGWSSYCASKAFMKQLISCYAIENPHVKFVSLAPGIIKTKMQDEIYQYSSEDIPSVQKFKDLYPTMDTSDIVANKIVSNIDDILSQDNTDQFFDLRSIKNG